MTTAHTIDRSTWRLCPGVKWLDGNTLAGGVPYRVNNRTKRGARLVHDLLAAQQLTPGSPGRAAGAVGGSRLRAPVPP
jgi:hypothetical protein